jgi:ABC-type proline/glycine betaine transport system permease subunit
MDSNAVSPVVGRNDDNDEKMTSTGRATPGSGHDHARPSAESNSIDVASDNRHPKPTLWRSFCQACWLVLTHSWVNVLLVFVPAGIIVEIVPGIHGGIIFALNCVAVIPLAGMLAFATESVASEMGDALGALMNVTFGNAVELIIL